MNKHSLIALAALFVSFAAQAAEPVAAATKPVAPVPAAVTPAPLKTVAATPALQKTAALSQQDKMRECSKQATGKKGAERKTFMKACLSKKA
jgi:hypothetical protein